MFDLITNLLTMLKYLYTNIIKFPMICLIYLLVITLTDCQNFIRIAQTAINQKNIQSNWKQINSTLNGLRELQLNHHLLTQTSLIKILNLSLSNLTSLQFVTSIENNYIGNPQIWQSYHVVTHQMIETIFTSQYFIKLSKINLSNTNLDDRSFLFLKDRNITSNLQYISLNGNLIGRVGLQLLSTITFIKPILTLQLQNCLLLQTEAVDAVIKMICGNGSVGCWNVLQVLDVSNSHITRDGMVRLLGVVNKTTLRVLKMNKLQLYFKKTLRQGFDYSLYQYLASHQFTALQALSMDYSKINNHICYILQNWYLPNLQNISLFHNPIDDRGVRSWLTVKNMPKLSSIILFQTEITDESVNHIISQNFSIKQLNIGYTKVSNKGQLQYLKQLSGCLQAVSMVQWNIKSGKIRQMVDITNFSKIKRLLIAGNSQIYDMFVDFPWQEMGNLQTLQFRNCDVSQSLFMFMNHTATSFPMLTKLSLQFSQMNETFAIELFQNIGNYFPNLQQLNLKYNSLYQANFAKLRQYFQRIRDGCKIVTKWLVLKKREDKFQILSMGYFRLFYMGFRQFLLSQKQKYFSKMFQFSTIRQLKFSDQYQLQLFITYCKNQDITILPEVIILSLTFKITLQLFTNLMNKIQMPSLNMLEVVINCTSNMTNFDVGQQLIQVFKQLQLLKYLKINLYSNNATFAKSLKIFFNSMAFPFLKEINIKGIKLELEDIRQFIINHNHTLRIADIGDNYLQNGLFELMGNTGLTLTQLKLNSVYFTIKQFASFSKVNTQFLKILILTQSDLTSDHLSQMLAQKTNQIVFPNLQQLDFRNNDIRSQSLKQLFQTNLQSLQSIIMEGNNNPDFINLLLGYPSRLRFIKAEDLDIYSVEKDIDGNATCQVEHLQITTKSLQEQDFANLAKLNFIRLHFSQIQIFDIYSCQVLLNILKICQWTNHFILSIRNQNEGLNSSCFSNITINNQIELVRIYDRYTTTNMPQFIQAIATGENDLRILQLVSTRLSPIVLAKIFTNNHFHSLQILKLKNNYLNDESLAILLNRSSLPHLSTLDLSFTQITDKSLQLLSNVSLPNLYTLDLSYTKISYNSISLLSRLQLPRLYILKMSGCELNGISLQNFKNSSLSKLMILELSNNKFTEDFNKTSFPRLFRLNLQGVALKMKDSMAVQANLTKLQVTVELTPFYNMKQHNSAGY